MAEVDAGQRDLRAPGLDEQADLVGHELGLQTAAGPPRARHDAEGAAVLAAVLDLEKRARAAERPRPRIDVGEPRAAQVPDLDAGRPRARPLEDLVQQRGQALLVGVADDEIHAGLARDLVGARLRPATRDDDARVGIGAARAADRLAVGDLGARRHRARVDDDDVRGGAERHRRKAARLEGRLPPLVVDLVEAAPQGREGEAAGRHATAAFNWPQAAPMSSPLLQRTVVVMPASSRIDWKSRMRASGGRRNSEAGQSLNGIRFTLARTVRSRRARRWASSGASFTDRK